MMLSSMYARLPVPFLIHFLRAVQSSRIRHAVAAEVCSAEVLGWGVRPAFWRAEDIAQPIVASPWEGVPGGFFSNHVDGANILQSGNIKGRVLDGLGADEIDV